MPKVTEEHRESRRAEILDAARRRFAQDGFHATSMQDILDECGLSAGAVYGYFAGKSDIVAAIARENVSTLLDALDACAESSTELSVADAVVAAIESVRTKDAPYDTTRLALQVWAESTRDPLLAARVSGTHERFRAIVASLIRRRHPAMAADADHLAGVIGTIVPGFILQVGLFDAQRTARFEDGVRLLLGEL